MIERLFRAVNEAGVDVDIGADELAEILWLAARIPPERRDPEADVGAAVEEGETPLESSGRHPTADRAADALPTRLFTASTGSVSNGGGRRGERVMVSRAASLEDPLAVMRSLRRLIRQPQFVICGFGVMAMRWR